MIGRQSYFICAYTCTNHTCYSSVMLHFVVAQDIVYKSNTPEVTWQVESVEHIEQYIKFVEKSHYLKRRGRKAFIELFFLWSKFEPG